MEYGKAVELLDKLKSKEPQLRLLAKIESMGIKIPEGKVDVSKLLRDNGYHELAAHIDKELKNI